MIKVRAGIRWLGGCDLPRVGRRRLRVVYQQKLGDMRSAVFRIPVFSRYNVGRGQCWKQKREAEGPNHLVEM